MNNKTICSVKLTRCGEQTVHENRGKITKPVINLTFFVTIEK